MKSSILRAAERVACATLLQSALDTAKIAPTSPQCVVLVDRNSKVQAALVYWGSLNGGWGLVGATPGSTRRWTATAI